MKQFALNLLEQAHDTFKRNIDGITLDESLQSAGGYRSVLGLIKHTAAWSHVYYSFAFEQQPRHWIATSWPLGVRDTIVPEQAYLDEVRDWYGRSFSLWRDALAPLREAAFSEPRMCHWRATAPLSEIVVMVANHWVYHAGEANAILSSVRGEAWEYTEEIEENHISTAGHRVRPDWMSDEHAARYEAYIAARDRELHGE